MFGRAFNNEAAVSGRKERASAHHSALSPDSDRLKHCSVSCFRSWHIDKAIFDTERFCGLVLARCEHRPDGACCEDGDPVEPRNHLLEDLEDFAGYVPFHTGKPGYISTWTRQVLYEAAHEWIRGRGGHDWDSPGHGGCGLYDYCALGDNYIGTLIHHRDGKL